ncbi:hypothetical protein KILIM_089_00070 [Kineosphaera limosa NBRC 100340]|uniref:Uncharacterized protein n=1 Tax=Kineosphaera limosa NBRC 100340 TaxID=1184609 RepID=K6X0Q4_9MICO|nr:hypothetical protein KILIM_089_00070 [Kineosphaera limosa NBRC 100340]
MAALGLAVALTTTGAQLPPDSAPTPGSPPLAVPPAALPLAVPAPMSTGQAHAPVRSTRAASAQFVTAGVTITAPPQQRPALPGQTPKRTSRAQAAAPVTVTSRLDVDGDGRADRTTLAPVRSTSTTITLRLSTRTAAGRNFSTLLTVDHDSSGADARSAWVGAGVVDGARGAEIVLDLNGGVVGDWPRIAVYTVRGEAWRLLRAPGARADRTPWATANLEYAKSGYTFSTKRGVRLVTVNRLAPVGDDPATGRYHGTRTTYRWARGAWAKSATQRVRGVSESQAGRLSGLNGLSLR